jgi:2-hydroxychromene-2-carboxylate isomerase
MNLQFYFDFISPNAYLAWRQLPTLLEGRDVEVEPVPVLFAALLDAHGQRGPAETPAKMAWMVRDILRKAKRLDIALNPPAFHPFNPLLALRISCTALPGEQKSALIDALFDAVWVHAVDAGKPAAVAESLKAAGFQGETLVQQASSPEVKARLKENTDAAVRAGVFGVPSMRVGDTLFWGFDDFAHLEAFLDGQDPLPTDELAAWSRVRSSASRAV